MIKYNYFLICTLIFISACVAPVKYEDIQTPNDRVAVAQNELGSFVKTAQKLKQRGVLQGADLAKIKSLLNDAETAIQAAITALSLGDLVQAEQAEILYINALYALREVLSE